MLLCLRPSERVVAVCTKDTKTTIAQTMVVVMDLTYASM